ncbi:MAG: hypothetical protein AABX71_02700 [Nanoarchaeota archaeon]
MVLSQDIVKAIVHSFSAHKGEFKGDLNMIVKEVAYETRCCLETAEKYLRQEGAIPETWHRQRRNYAGEEIQAMRDRFNTYLREGYQGNITPLLFKVAEDCGISITPVRKCLAKEISEFAMRKHSREAKKTEEEEEDSEEEQEEATKKQILTPKLKQIAIDAYQKTGYPPDAAEMTGLTIEQIVSAWSKDNLEVQPNRRDLTGVF